MGTVALFIPEPNPKQRLFLSELHRHVCYGGGRGGGKSWVVRVKAILLCSYWKGIKVLIVRRTYPELVNNHVLPLMSMIPKELAVYKKADKAFVFNNGSAIYLGHCDNDRDVQKYQGAEYDIIFFDEATQLKEDWIKKINLAIREPNGLPKRTYYTCNPGGVSHAYIKRLFITKKYKDGEVPENYAFIQALVTDNKVLMEKSPEYMAELLALPPKLREAWLYGSWDVYEGQFFEEFLDDPEHYIDRRYTHVIEPFEIPSDWKIYRSFDWGYNKPFSCGWWAVDHDGVVYRILELYGCRKDSPDEGVRWTREKVFGEIHRIESEHRWLKGKNIRGVADPAIWDAQYGDSTVQVAAKNLVYFDKGDNARIPGWMQMHYRMSFDENGRAMMYVFKNCEAFIRTIPLLCYDDNKPEDIDTKMEDHVADESRYFLMSRPIKPRRLPTPDKYEESPMSMFLDIPKEDIIARPQIPRIEIIEE